jgi:predicted Ser/Thr protein kinase
VPGERISEADAAFPSATPLSEELTVDSALREASNTRAGGDAGRFSGTERFQVTKWLGRGGFGVVYEALDRRQHSMVALKLLRRPYAELLYRFKREFRALAEVRHRNLVRLYDLEAAGRDVFFTMELVEGAPLLDHIGRRPERAREALRQLAEGLNALHRAGKLHRDVKPSNILVEKGGRVVLLDFGLAVELGAPESDSADRAGTPLYMSPEQCAARPLSEASDWYSAGVVLFEALTGRRPFEGDEVETAKQVKEAPRASSLQAGIPAELDDLCAALLQRDPAARPTGEELLRLLRAAPVPQRASEPFIGRAAELALLWRVFAAGQSAMVLAHGPSGMGKSALLRRFLDEVARRRPETLILAGRCYERESVPYKALDAVVDELARHLRQLPAPEVETLLVREAAALCKLFPVLRRVPAFHDARAAAQGDVGEVRSRGLTALRELFARLGARGPVVVCIDDLQWGDVDSAVLLAELVRQPDAPAVFWLVSFRGDELATSPMLRRLTALRESTLAETEIHDLPLGALGGEEAQQLATALLVEAHGDGARAQAIAAESRGSPFFVQELARGHFRGGEGALDELVRRRVALLAGAARGIVEVVAVAARPLELQVLASAAGVEGDLGAQLAHLRSERWIRAREGDGEKLLESYHDRIREAVVSGIAPGPLKALHLRLAAALEQSQLGDAARIGRHLADGGDAAHAQVYLVRAAEQAASALAFDEAAHLYQTALDLGPADPLPLELARAEALSAAGRGPEAAHIWLAAVDRVEAGKRTNLTRRASEELLLSGRVDEGFAAIGTVLGELGLSLPRSHSGAMAQAAWGLLRQKIRAPRLRLRRTPCSARELEQVDALAGLSWAVAMLDPLIGYALQTQHLRLAFRSGDRVRAALALALEAPLAAMKGTQRERTRRMLDTARELAAGAEKERIPDAMFSAVEGISALMEGRWLEAREHLDQAQRQANAGPIGHGSLSGTVAAMRMMTLFWMGRSGDLLQEVPLLLRSMEERSNLYGWLFLKLLEGWAHSCSGRLASAWAASTAARERLPERGFQLQRWYLEYGQVKFLLLEARCEEAWQRLETLTQATRFSTVGQVQRASGLWVRASAALGCAQVSPGTRKKMLGEARRMVRKLERERTPWILAIARALQASIASVAGDGDAALRLLGEAEPLLDEQHLESVAAIARLARGGIIVKKGGGEAGREIAARAESWQKAQRVSPVVARVLLPGEWSA